MAKKITPKQLAAQWATLPNKFEVNVLDFEVIMGKTAVFIFQQSFYLKRLNAPGSPAWPARKHHYSHLMLMETGNLKRSITYKRFKHAQSQGVTIYSDPRALVHSKRQSTMTRDFFYYSRVHNDGASDANIDQRQFIGHSSYITDKLKSNSSRIFNGFPK